MTCASCSSHIERTILSLPGVQEVSVNLLGNSGTFRFDNHVIGIRDIAEKIDDIGFSATLSDAHSASSVAQVESLKRTEEARKWRRLFLLSLLFSVPVSTISMILPVFAPGLVHYRILPGLALGNFAQFCLTIPVLFRIGRPLHVAAYKAVKHGSATMDVLVSLGTNIAFFFSTLALLHGVFSPGFKPAIFFETSSTLITFITLGRWLYVPDF